MLLEDRFLKYVDKVSSDKGCWLWTAGVWKYGYGKFGLCGKARYAHRVSWMLFNGAIPEGLKVLHKCDNPPCVNPDHLFIGTYKDNSDDMIKKGRDRKAFGDRNGVRLHPEIVIGSKNGNSKLTDEYVKDIRKRYAEGETQVSLSLEYNVYTTCISKIVHNKTWKHLI